MEKHALIVAGGSGNRMGSNVPKQFLLLNGLPVLMHTMNRFWHFDNKMDQTLVLPEAQFAYWQQLCVQFQFKVPHRLVAGGSVRFNSVKNGLASISGDGLVAIHDGVRPLVSRPTLLRCFEMAREKGNAIPALPLIETLREVSPEANQAADRSRFVGIQTPQVFDVKLIKEAYSLPYNPAFTDDAMVLEQLGRPINLVDGNRENIKITHASDLDIAAALWHLVE
jgi:2-C-methyl-D-erythritol 4-phosphate cytidylyltransferase